MLNTLIIRNLALIEELEVELDRGLNVITGETGAGKSIAIGAMQLLFGKRADRSSIRSGADQLEVSAIIDLSEKRLRERVNTILDESGIAPCEDGQLVVNRRVREQSGRNFVNNTPVTLQVLKQLGDLLVDIHGPYDNQSLLRTAHQLEVLDDYADLEKDLRVCRDLHAAWRGVKDKLAAAEEESPSEELVDYLKFQIREIEQANPQPDEDEELTARHEVAANAHQILGILNLARDTLSDSDDAVISQIGNVLRSMLELERMDPENGKAFCESLERAVTELQELETELTDYASRVEVDPQEFDEMEARMAELRRLKRKYGGTIEDALAHADDCRERLRKLENFDEYRAELIAELKQAEGKLRKKAEAISERRKKAAKKLGPEITKKLKFLGFPDCKFSIELSEGELGPLGFDEIEFIFAPNPGEGSRPLREIASSGEIARVMLALKTVLAHADRVPILIFDEVDANIGGVVANRVGEELRRLGDGHQVFCVTHQPQVAAGAHRHFVVEKATKNKRTSATLKQLCDGSRVDEIARMLGGEESASVVKKHAGELIKRATVKP